MNYSDLLQEILLEGERFAFTNNPDTWVCRASLHLGGLFHLRFPDQPIRKDSWDSVLAGCSSILRYATSGEIPVFSDIEINH